MVFNFDIKNNECKKYNLLKYYRNCIEETVHLAQKESENSKKSKLINKRMKELLSIKLEEVSDLNSILLIHYTYYIVMLESRNSVWEYDYMSFSRRIGELWEPFCKLAFKYSINKINFYEPKNYEQYKFDCLKKFDALIQSLNINNIQRKEISNYFYNVLSLIDSGSINLKEDLHFSHNNDFFVIDFKSGFNSNEKGNVNRLLQVAKIYSTMNYKCIILVRQPEKENNHYLQTLKNSNLWEVFCNNEAYNKIYQLTGVNLKQWMNDNMLWVNDISEKFRNYLEKNNLLQYLTW
jgi:hypothetical protein